MKKRIICFLIMLLASFLLSGCFIFVGEAMEYDYTYFISFDNAMNNLYDNNLITYNYYLLDSEDVTYRITNIKVTGFEKVNEEVNNYSSSPTMIISYLIITYTKDNYTYEVHYEIVEPSLDIEEIKASTYAPSKYDTELYSSVYYGKTCLIDYVYATRSDEVIDVDDLKNARTTFINYYLSHCMFYSFTSK